MSTGESRILKIKFGERLRMVRGMDRQKDFASELGEIPSKISQYEAGINFPPIEFLILLAERKRVNLHWLIVGEGEMFLDPQKNTENNELYPELAGMKHLTDQFVHKASEVIEEYNAKKAKIEARKNPKVEKK